MMSESDSETQHSWLNPTEVTLLCPAQKYIFYVDYAQYCFKRKVRTLRNLKAAASKIKTSKIQENRKVNENVTVLS